MPHKSQSILKDFASRIAYDMGVTISNIDFVDGHRLGTKDKHLLNILSQKGTVSVVVFQSDINNLLLGKECSRLEVRLRTVLLTLKQ
jgi:hypothetical protein